MNGIRTNGSRITPLAVASGAIASFDAQVAAPLKILKADIIAAQAGSGDPSPSNIRPISGWDEIKITNESGEMFEAANIEASKSEIKAYYNADLVLSKGTYVFSTDATDTVILMGAQYYSGSWNNIFTQIGTSRKFTLSRSGKCHFRAELRGSGDLSSNTVSLKQLDERTIELPDTVYGGKLDVLKGEGIESVIGFNLKDLEWTQNTYSQNIFNGTLPVRARNQNSGYISEEYKNTNSISLLNEDFSIAISSARTVVYIHDSRFNGIAEFIAGVNSKMAYEVDSPDDFQTTPINMDAYAGSNKITTDSGNTTACYLKGVTT